MLVWASTAIKVRKRKLLKIETRLKISFDMFCYYVQRGGYFYCIDITCVVWGKCTVLVENIWHEFHFPSCHRAAATKSNDDINCITIHNFLGSQNISTDRLTSLHTKLISLQAHPMSTDVCVIVDHIWLRIFIDHLRLWHFSLALTALTKNSSGLKIKTNNLAQLQGE